MVDEVPPWMQEDVAAFRATKDGKTFYESHRAVKPDAVIPPNKESVGEWYGECSPLGTRRYEVNSDGSLRPA